MKRCLISCLMVSMSVWPAGRCSAATAEVVNSATMSKIAVLDKTITVISTKTLESCTFSTQFRKPGIYSEDAVPAKGNRFILIHLETEFPAGPGLDMRVFVVTQKGKTERAFFPIGFTHGGSVTQERPLRLYRAEEGAAGYFDETKTITIMDNPLGKPGQIYFAYMQDKNGKDIHWPGGKASVKLLYEIPQSADNLQLENGKIETRQLALKIPASGKTDPTTARPTNAGDATVIASLPSFEHDLHGANPVRVRNPNTFAVRAALRLGQSGKDMDIPANGMNTVYIPNGRYDIFFVYSEKPDALFQGDSFTLNNNGVEIQIVKMVNGNYGIRQVK